MLDPSQKRILRAFLEGRTEGRDVVDFSDETLAVKKALPILGSLIEGKDISVALRAVGFNRAYDIAGRKRSDIIYRRAA